MRFSTWIIPLILAITFHEAGAYRFVAHSVPQRLLGARDG